MYVLVKGLGFDVVVVGATFYGNRKEARNGYKHSRWASRFIDGILGKFLFEASVYSVT